MLHLFAQTWPDVFAALHLLVAAVASVHVVLHKRDSRAAIGWAGLIWLSPFVGAALYTALGVNRVQRKASTMRPRLATVPALPGGSLPEPEVQGNLATLARLSGQVTGRRLLSGNRVTPLTTGDLAFAAMQKAIDGATASVALATFIFDNDAAGLDFADALGRAHARGVDVRVLVDDVGSRYSMPPILGALRHHGVRVANFMPTLVPWRLWGWNLRNHRKILVVDGRVGFTGGMNIREGALSRTPIAQRIADLHFRLEGPVVEHLQEAFATDWAYTTRELLRGERWFPGTQAMGPTWARGIPEGPDSDLDKLRMVLLGALACADSSVEVVTPYFLPDDALLTALEVAAMRGVEVDVVLPRHNNLTLVAWASASTWSPLVERGCRIWLSELPFDHTKLMVVDRQWSLIGSANWDPRSLRLNFEFDVECYDAELAQVLHEQVVQRISRCRRVSVEELRSRPLLVKLRDGLTSLGSPYL